MAQNISEALNLALNHVPLYATETRRQVKAALEELAQQLAEARSEMPWPPLCPAKVPTQPWRTRL